MQATQNLKERVRTPKEMAKAAMKSRALDELSALGLDSTAKVTVEYMGISHTLEGKVTVNVDNGQIMFFFGGTTPFELESDGQIIDMRKARFGANLFTKQSIENWKEIRERHHLPDVKVQSVEETDEEFSKAESVA